MADGITKRGGCAPIDHSGVVDRSGDSRIMSPAIHQPVRLADLRKHGSGGFRFGTGVCAWPQVARPDHHAAAKPRRCAALDLRRVVGQANPRGGPLTARLSLAYDFVAVISNLERRIVVCGRLYADHAYLRGKAEIMNFGP